MRQPVEAGRAVSEGSKADRCLAPVVMAQLGARFPVQEVEHALLPSRFACPTAVQRDPDTGQASGMTDPMQPLAGVAAAARAA